MQQTIQNRRTWSREGNPNHEKYKKMNEKKRKNNNEIKIQAQGTLSPTERLQFKRLPTKHYKNNLKED